jgi:MFS family permease
LSPRVLDSSGAPSQSSALAVRSLSVGSAPAVAAVDASDRFLTRTFAFLWLGNFAFYTGHLMLLPAIPLYVLFVGGQPADAGVVVGSMQIASLAARFVTGPVADFWGRKPLLLVGAGMYIVAALLYPVVSVIPLLILVRLIHGFGNAWYNTGSNALIADSVPPRRRGEAIGYFGMATSLGMVIGPVLGVTIVAALSFTGLFAVGAALACLSLCLIVGINAPRISHPTGRRRLSLGAVVSRDALLPAVLAFTNTVSWGGAAAFVAIFATQRGVDNPGLFFGTVAATMLCCRVFVGRSADRFGRRAVIVPGSIVSVAGLLVLAATHGTGMYVVAAALFGLGFGSVLPTVQALAADRAHPHRRGVAMSTYSMGIDIGSSAGALLLAPFAQAGAYEAMWGAAAASVVAGLLIYLVGDRKTKSEG